MTEGRQRAREAVLRGGCQCGAVRYELLAWPDEASICHCRMCQKAFGNVIAPLARVDDADIGWTRGPLSVFRSSEAAERGFCAACGTPLTYRCIGTGQISVSIGSLDEPARVAPTIAFGLEGRLPWFDDLAALPGTRTEEDIPAEELPRFRSRQHPDGEG